MVAQNETEPLEIATVGHAESGAGAIIDYALTHVPKVEQRSVKLDDSGLEAQFAVVPNGFRLESLQPLLEAQRSRPRQREGTANFTDVDSLIRHVNRFKDVDSALFCDPDPTHPVLIGVIDYHRATAEGEPRFGKHRARYPFPLSEEWSAWVVASSKVFTQQEFAHFLEERIADVADPASAGEKLRDFATAIGTEFASPMALMTLSRGLTVRLGGVAKQSYAAASGEAALVFEQTHHGADGAPLKVPGAFVINIPVFQLGALHKIAVRLLYRVADDGKVKWMVRVNRIQENFDYAIREACRMAEDGTKLPLYYGRPEKTGRDTGRE